MLKTRIARRTDVERLAVSRVGEFRAGVAIATISTAVKMAPRAV